MQHCTETSKLRYTEQEAKNRAINLQRADRDKKERFWYACDACGDWHVTTYREYRPVVDDGTLPRTADDGGTS